MTNPNLLWLDLETTGVDEDKDSIIEIGCVLTSGLPGLVVLGEYVEHVRPTDQALGRLLRNDIVATMHTENGLLNEITDLTRTFKHPGEVQLDVIRWIDNIVDTRSVVLAGSGVAHFDRRFLKAHMPKLDRRLRHWSIDVGVIRRFFAETTGSTLGPDPSVKTHRALDDAYLHLREAREFVTYLLAAEDLFGEHT
jgi:oligoribonuclease